ncbi:hypothetical protein AEAC466_13470 [Asticcacaulis sp. AC466]|uniref:phage tail assembly chaperone n=1 Tax=Asticcacaulis sp. AC466 TaxID=1282362 RepID=UPI0003C3F0F2|nr:hypothetical protein [Asticcacaulis sp. AC466]ESQ83256.1 hypothetical protein AEAC466_13470 [Asticcacaulis sp. AC466]
MDTAPPPALLPGANQFLQAFWEVSHDRPVGFGVGPVPFGAIDRWARRYGIDDADDFDDLVGAIRVMDGVYLDRCNSASDKTAERKPRVSRPLTANLFDVLLG